MAKIRTVKPEFWTDSKIVALTPLARLLFIGILNFADDYGRMRFDLLSIKLRILPTDPTDCAGEIGELRRESLVTTYEVDGQRYLHVNNFSKHQKVDKRTESRLPPPPPIPAESPHSPPNHHDGREGKGGEGSSAYQGEDSQEEKDLHARGTAAPDGDWSW